MDHPKYIAEFVNRTGADNSLAKNVLEEHNWNVNNAVKAYKLVHTAALPPVGRRKNVDTNQRQSGSESSPISTLERRLKRGLSKTTENLPLVTKARQSVLQDISEADSIQHFVETPEYTFILPDLSRFSRAFQGFLHKALIETSTLVSLEQAGRLNWWADYGICSKLLPLATSGDGNCLLHAASLGMWGFHDRELTLRRALYNALGTGVVRGAFWRRWRWQQTQVNKQFGLILTEDEWKTEWNNMLKLASTTPRVNPGSKPVTEKSVLNGVSGVCVEGGGGGKSPPVSTPDCTEDSKVFYESLEEFHVFVLAHVLHRSIVVVADTFLKNSEGEALAPIPFGGIYLPLQCPPSECHRSPLLLTYDAAHFSALVPMEEGDGEETMTTANHTTAAIPVVDPDFQLLPIHFLTDPGESFNWSDAQDDRMQDLLDPSLDDKLKTIQHYMDLIKVPVSESLSSPATEGCPGGSAGDLRPRSSSWSGPKDAVRYSSSLGSGSDRSSKSASGSSDNIISVTSKTKVKDKKRDKERLRSAKQIQSVVKSFGSLGKTMSKTLKNLGGFKTSLGNHNNSGKTAERDKSVSGSYMLKSDEVRLGPTKTSSLRRELRDDGSSYHGQPQALCAQIRHKRLEYQDKLVENYLQAAWQNFEQEQVMLSGSEPPSYDVATAKDHSKENVRPEDLEGEMSTVGVIGDSQGLATSFLSPLSHDRHGQDATTGPDERDAGVVNDPSGTGDHSEVTVATSSNTQRVSGGGEFRRQNTLVNVGMSKFYTYADEDQSLQRPKYPEQNSSNLLSSLNNSQAASRTSKVDKAPLELSRSSFYDQSLTSSGGTSFKLKPEGNTSFIINNLLDEPSPLSDKNKDNQHLGAGAQRDSNSKHSRISVSLPGSSCTPKVHNAPSVSEKIVNTSKQEQAEWSSAGITHKPMGTSHVSPGAYHGSNL